MKENLTQSKNETEKRLTLNKEQNKNKYTLITLNNKRNKMCVAVGSQKQYIVIHMYNSLFLYYRNNKQNKGLFEITDKSSSKWRFGPPTKE